MSAANIHIYQIFYDDASRDALDPGFIPWDNTENERPDWYEFWVIRKALRALKLEPDHWYGFLSPRFRGKTNLRSDYVHAALANAGPANVAIFPVGWDQVAYFLNVFEQGEHWHPGISAVTQAFLKSVGMDVGVNELVMHSANAVLSNYIVAKPDFWRVWLQLADRLFDYVEGAAEGDPIVSGTAYGSLGSAPMKTFVQERLAPLILSSGKFNVLTIDQGARLDISDLFDGRAVTRRALQAMDFMKQQYCLTNDLSYLDMYWKVRRTVQVKRVAKLQPT